MSASSRFDQSVIEQAALTWLAEAGYIVHARVDAAPESDLAVRSDYREVILMPRLLQSLRRLNPELPEEAILLAGRALTRPTSDAAARRNLDMHRLLVDGFEVEYRRPSGELRDGRVRFVDFTSPQSNEFMVVPKFAVQSGGALRILDLVAFVNGLPLVVIELKSAANESSDTEAAYEKLQAYGQSIPQLLDFNEVLVASDGYSTFIGSLTSVRDRFVPWRSQLSGTDHPSQSLEGLVRTLLTPEKLVQYIRHFITFNEDKHTGDITKRIANYHQFRAGNSALQSVRAALRPAGDGRGGVIWHTQGSGKSLTMLMLASCLIADPALENPTIVVVTDRSELDDQLFAAFTTGTDLLQQPLQQAQSRADLASSLTRSSGGVIFTTIQKFASTAAGPASTRANIVVFADEAHRSQYGGGARWMRDALPNATFIGFTGTPIELSDRSTRQVFGEYIDIYDVQQSIEDGSTVPIYFEPKVIRLSADQDELVHLKAEVEATARLSESRSLEIWDMPLSELVGSKRRIGAVAHEVVTHLEARRGVMRGKAMVACMSRRICVDLYDELANLRPYWHSEDDDKGFMKVVMTESPLDPEHYAAHTRNRQRRNELARRFLDPDSGFSLAIVCDMWLSGLDCPPLDTLYLDKPLSGHSLMQTIARVNRAFGDKPGGVVVDFLGLADELQSAVRQYAESGRGVTPVYDVQSEEVPIMRREFDALRDFMSPVSYAGFVHMSEEGQTRAVTAGADHVLARPDGQQLFLDLVASLSRAFALSVPADEALIIRDDVAYFQAVRAALLRRLRTESPRTTGSDFAVRQLMSGAIVAHGVVDLFSAAGLPDPELGVLSDEFLDQLAGLPQQNLALEAIRKLLTDQVRSRQRVNIVQARDFRQALDDVVLRYTNRSITSANAIDELIELARAVRTRVTSGSESGLNEAELAIYDILAESGSAGEAMDDDTLRTLARELTESVRAKLTLDWTVRETVRADMRRTVRRLLARYGYPPDAQEPAIQLVIEQAELLGGGDL